MRFAVIRGYRMAGPLHEYAFGPFSHETPKKIVTSESVHHRRIHDKADLVCLCESEDQAATVCKLLDSAKVLYLDRVAKASAEYDEDVGMIIARAREEADQLTAEVDAAIAAPRSGPRRRREFVPELIKGGRE